LDIISATHDEAEQEQQFSEAQVSQVSAILNYVLFLVLISILFSHISLVLSYSWVGIRRL
jgi:hypothetical protein